MKKQIIALTTAAMLLVSSSAAFAAPTAKYHLDSDGFVVWDEPQEVKVVKDISGIGYTVDKEGFVTVQNNQTATGTTATTAYRLDADGFVVWENQQAPVISKNAYTPYHLDADGFIVWETNPGTAAPVKSESAAAAPASTDTTAAPANTDSTAADGETDSTAAPAAEAAKQICENE